MRRHASEGWACAGFYLRYAYPAYDETLHLDLGIASLRHDKWCNRGMDQEIAFKPIDEHTMSFVEPVNPDISHKAGASGLCLSDNAFTTQSYRSTEEVPDADTVYPKAV